MKSNTIKELVIDGLKNLLKNRIITTFAIFTVFVSLTVVNTFTILYLTVNKNIDNLQEDVKVVAFIEDKTSLERINELNKTISENELVKDIEFISQEDGLDEYKETLKSNDDEEMARIIEEVTAEGKNPIPASFKITPSSTTDIAQVKKELLDNEEIYKVDDASNVTGFLQTMKGMIGNVGLIFILIMIIVSILLISNTIKVAVFTRKREIGIMKYIGATDNYVRLPFLVEGLVIGLIGAIVSLLLVAITYNTLIPNLIKVLNSYISGFVSPSLGSILIYMIPVTIIVGMLTGIIGSFISIRKYLNV